MNRSSAGPIVETVLVAFVYRGPDGGAGLAH